LEKDYNGDVTGRKERKMENGGDGRVKGEGDGNAKRG